MYRIFGTLILISFLCTSCGPVTPIANHKDLSATPITTGVAEISTPATETETPHLDADDFELNPWADGDPYYSNLVSEYNTDFHLDFANNNKNYALIFEAESLLRENPKEWRDAAWEIVKYAPKGIPLPGM